MSENSIDERLFSLATRFYERRLDKAEQVRLKFADYCESPPGWTFDYDTMQVEAWDEARRFIEARFVEPGKGGERT